jgi:sucrose-6-phosphate hydrolase SacC (GH32 family)
MKSSCMFLLSLQLINLGINLVEGAYDQRPAYHVTPEEGQWINDPNGPMYVDGYYHLFFQCNPYGTDWGNMSWAHVVSDDLVNWKRLNIALYNDEPYDIYGVFSGSAAIKNDTPYLFYTCVDDYLVERQCLATNDSTSSSAELENWVKSDANPIIPNVPLGWDPTNFRDPTVWPLEIEQTWSMITAASARLTGASGSNLNNVDFPSTNSIGGASASGSGGDTGVGIIALHSTGDGEFPLGWQYAGPLWSSADPLAGCHTWMVECPDLFSGNGSAADIRRDNKEELYVLKYSVQETRQEYYEV